LECSGAGTGSAFKLKEQFGDRPASSLVVFLGKALNGIDSTFEWFD